MARIILVTGSRDATKPMRLKAREVVVWIAANQYELLVGDAPGIDEACRTLGAEVGLRPYVYGAYGKIRQPEINPTGERRIIVPGGYLARDRVMGDQCSACVAIWNGRSWGTQYTGLYVESLGKVCRWPCASPHLLKTPVIT
jgi:hypothetical protein